MEISKEILEHLNEPLIKESINPTTHKIFFKYTTELYNKHILEVLRNLCDKVSYQIRDKIFHISLSYLLKILVNCKNETKIENFDLLLLSIFYLSLKLIEIQKKIPKIQRLKLMYKEKYRNVNENEIKKTEIFCLRLLNYNINTATPYDYLYYLYKDNGNMIYQPLEILKNKYLKGPKEYVLQKPLDIAILCIQKKLDKNYPKNTLDLLSYIDNNKESISTSSSSGSGCNNNYNTNYNNYNNNYNINYSSNDTAIFNTNNNIIKKTVSNSTFINTLNRSIVHTNTNYKNILNSNRRNTVINKNQTNLNQNNDLLKRCFWKSNKSLTTFPQTAIPRKRLTVHIKSSKASPIKQKKQLNNSMELRKKNSKKLSIEKRKTFRQKDLIRLCGDINKFNHKNSGINIVNNNKDNNNDDIRTVKTFNKGNINLKKNERRKIIEKVQTINDFSTKVFFRRNRINSNMTGSKNIPNLKVYVNQFCK